MKCFFSEIRRERGRVPPQMVDSEKKAVSAGCMPPAAWCRGRQSGLSDGRFRHEPGLRRWPDEGAGSFGHCIYLPPETSADPAGADEGRSAETGAGQSGRPRRSAAHHGVSPVKIYRPEPTFDIIVLSGVPRLLNAAMSTKASALAMMPYSSAVIPALSRRNSVSRAAIPSRITLMALSLRAGISSAPHVAPRHRDTTPSQRPHTQTGTLGHDRQTVAFNY